MSTFGIDSKILSYSDFLTKSEKFSDSKRQVSAHNFLLPDFQRNFVWTNREIRRLISDIRESENLYLGNIVTSSEKDGFDNLIDGQQRLVTLSLICIILAKKTKNKKLENEIFSLIFKNKDEPRINFSKSNINLFYRKVTRGEAFKARDESEKFIQRAIKNIENETKFLKTESDTEDFLKKIKKVNFVLIKCLEKSELSKLFVGLNSTGIELSQTELVKGYIISRLDEDSIKQSAKKRLTYKWIKMEKDFEKTNIFWFNQFLKHQWYLVGGHITSNKLSDKINIEKIKKDEKTLKKYIDQVVDDSKIYIKLKNNKSSELIFPKGTRGDSARKISSILENIHWFNLQQIYPVILALYNYGRKNIEFNKNGTSLKVFEKIWMFVVLAKYSQVIPSKYEKIFARFCFDISQSNCEYKNFKNIINTFFAELAALVSDSESKFSKELNKDFALGEVKFAKVLLFNLIDKNKMSNYSNLEIEHILPRAKDGKGDFREWKQIPKNKYEEMSAYVHLLGNLTLLESKLNNSEAKNLNHLNKDTAYKKSSLEHNKNLFKSYDFSTVQKIKKSISRRSLDMSKEIFDIYLNELNKKIK